MSTTQKTPAADLSHPNEEQLNALVASLLETDKQIEQIAERRKELVFDYESCNSALDWQDEAGQKVEATAIDRKRVQGELDAIRKASKSAGLLAAVLNTASPSAIGLRIHHVRANRAHAQALKELELARQEVAAQDFGAQESILKTVEGLNKSIAALRVQRAELLEQIQLPLRIELTALADKWEQVPTGSVNREGFSRSEVLARKVRKDLRELSGEALIKSLRKHRESVSSSAYDEFAEVLYAYSKRFPAPPRYVGPGPM